MLFAKAEQQIMQNKKRAEREIVQFFLFHTMSDLSIYFYGGTETIRFVLRRFKEDEKENLDCCILNRAIYWHNRF